MYIIILCSVVAMGFIIERLLSFKSARCDMETLFAQIENAIKLGKLDEATSLCSHAKGLIPQIIIKGLINKDESLEDIRRILIDEIQITALPSLQKNLGVLATIAKASPMLGLLGTVLGMIDVFEKIGKHGLGDPQKMAGGIGLALITTAGGLIVAIPIMFIHSYLKGRIRDFELDIYHYLTRFLRVMGKRKGVSS